ncbi:neuropeptide Y receptor type 2 [Octopus bimaculoides]|uniref:G-protein coupled receptors family 1 profile domain-containing protein n=1 Tax=Octopus bimaculoides TaxID=37653 RepID=A0A0L8GIJ7_OCTBM|nr:neuropeptide Y receptor type 2 [Octopus bimaculoides]|eukprot:XP_014780784.1 PREDICTED: neuropeptide Y receptor type 2-like [Octopus bimaculoides]
MNKSYSERLFAFNQQEIERHIAMITLLFIIMIMGIIGNSLVVYIHILKLNRTASTTLVIFLGWSQIINSAICVPMDIVFLFHPYIFTNDVLCRFMQSVVFMSVLVSGLIIFTIAIDRFKKVCRPFATQFTRKAVKKIILLNIVITTLPMSVNCYVRGIKEISLSDNLIGHMCSISDKAVPTVVYGFFIFMLALCVLSVLTFIIIYSTIFGKLREYGKRKRLLLASLQPSLSRVSERTSSRDEHSISERSKDPVFRPMQRRRYYIATTQITFNMFFITLSLCLTYIPYFTLTFLTTKVSIRRNGWEPPNNIFYKLADHSYYINDLIIPIIYVIFSPSFRREVMVLFKQYILCNICNKPDEN